MAKALCDSCYSMSTTALMFRQAPLTSTSFLDQINALDVETSFDMPPQPPEHWQLRLAK
jgi:hypothetical protein